MVDRDSNGNRFEWFWIEDEKYILYTFDSKKARILYPFFCLWYHLFMFARNYDEWKKETKRKLYNLFFKW